MATSKTVKVINVGDKVTINGGVKGEVIGKSTYATKLKLPDNHWVRFIDKSTDLPREDWFTDELLTVEPVQARAPVRK